MSRQWTARRTTALVESEIEPSDFRATNPLYRAGPELTDARRHVLRLFAAHALVLLPLQVGVYFLAAHSLGLTVSVTLVIAAVLAAVALAKWMRLEDLLQKLPLLVLLALVGIGLLYLTARSTRARDAGGIEFFGTLFIVIAIVSILGNLYQPLAAAYQTLTLKTPARDLAIAAVGLVVSLALAAFGQAIPQRAALLLAFTLTGGYASVVVVEYVAWMRANPDRSLDRPGQERDVQKSHTGSALVFGLVTGLGYGLFVTLLVRPPQGSPWTDPTEFLTFKSDGLTTVRLWCLAFFIGGIVGTNFALNTLRPPRHTGANLRLAFDALVVFLTYPNTSHPLAHRMNAKWLRPLSVRLVLTGLVFSAATNALLSSTRRADLVPNSEKDIVAEPLGGAMPGARLRAGENLPPFGGWHAGFGNGPASFPTPDGQPRTTSTETTDGNAETIAERFISSAAILVLFPPALIYALVFTLGAIALPHYYHRYEAPAVHGPAA